MKKLSRKLLVIIWILMAFFVFKKPALATAPTSPNIVGYHFGSSVCKKFSLTESLIAETNGQIGPKCDFTLDVRARGDYQSVGGYGDSPPYSWGGHDWIEFYLAGPSRLSFTCDLPQYSLDESSLPSFIQLGKVEDISSSESIVAPGKRYHFSVSENASTGQSFNIQSSFSSTCAMNEDRPGHFNVTTPAPEKPHSSHCPSRESIEINPRGASKTIALALTESCLDTPTPTLTPAAATVTPIPPTATPIPTTTSSPAPTATPVPTATPTRTPPASCACWLLATEGNPDLSQVSKGQTLNFIAEAHTSTPATAEVREMVFVLEHNGSEIANSGTIPAYFNRSEIIGGVNTDVYQSTWSYQVPNTDTAKGLYYLKIIINCGWKESSVQENFGVLGQAVAPTDKLTPTPKKAGFGFGSLIQRVLELLGLREKNGGNVQNGKSLQLGTFGLVPTLPAGGCTDLYFQVTE